MCQHSINDTSRALAFSPAKASETQEDFAMLKNGKSDESTITSILTKWIMQQDSEEAFEDESDLEKSTFRRCILVNDQPFQMFFEADEPNRWLSVYAYGPIKVTPSRMGEMTRLLNNINLRLTIGRLACVDDDDANPVQYRARISLNGGTLAAQQIDDLALAAWRICTIYGPIISRVALTKVTTKECWADLLQDEAAGRK